MPIETVATADAPRPAGHYAQATVHDGLIFVAGQLGVLPDGTHRPEAPFEAQARQALENVLAIVRAGGSGPERILKVNVYIVGVEFWPAFNAVYAELFGDARPARAVIPVPELHHGYLVEVDAIAAR
jgi:reactive intermediate/imine deaminase